MDKATPESFKAVSNALKSNGATSIRVNSGPVINKTLEKRLEKTVESGKSILGLKVTKTNDPNNMYILEGNL